jgi:hypothetical protein
MKIGIVGGGATGIITSIVASNFLRSRQRPVRIDIFESGLPFRGRAFNTDSDNMLLNTSVGVSSIDPFDDRGFHNYLKHHEGSPVGLGDMVPRDAARRYFQSEYGRASRETSNSRIIPARVDRVSVDEKGQPCVHSNAGLNSYDAIVLATGLQFKPAPEAVQGLNVISPYPADRLSGIDKDASILLLGSSLSAVDALVHLASVGHRGPIRIHSRSGMFPAVRRQVVKPASRTLLEQYLAQVETRAPNELRSFLLIELLDRYVERAGMRLADFFPAASRGGFGQLDREIHLCKDGQNVWEPVMMDIIDGLNHIWPNLLAEEKRHFHELVIGPWLGRLVIAMPLRNAVIVRSLFERGQLCSIGTGELTAQKVGFYHIVINATGLQRALADPLLASMANYGSLRFNASGGVAIDALSHRLHVDTPIYANGPIIQDEIFTANSVYSAVHGAHRIAVDLLGITNRKELPALSRL